MVVAAVAAEAAAEEADKVNSTPNDPHSSGTQPQEVPPQSQDPLSTEAGEDLEVTSCPHGHGDLKPWEDHLRCWTCGWNTTTGSKPDRPKYRPPGIAAGCLSQVLRFVVLLVGPMAFFMIIFFACVPEYQNWSLPLAAIAFLTFLAFLISAFRSGGGRSGGYGGISGNGGGGGCGGCGGGE